MSNVVEQIQQAIKDQGDAAMASAKTLTTSIQAIATGLHQEGNAGRY